MATVPECVLLSQPDKLVLLAEIPATGAPGSQPTFRLLVEQSYGAEDVDTMEDETCGVPHRDLDCQGTVDRAFQGLVARLHNPMLRPEVAPEANKAAARVRAGCVAVPAAWSSACASCTWTRSRSRRAGPSDTGFRYGLPDLQGDLDDAWYEQNQAVLGDDAPGGHFAARSYHRALMREGGPSDVTLPLSGFAAPSSPISTR